SCRSQSVLLWATGPEHVHAAGGCARAASIRAAAPTHSEENPCAETHLYGHPTASSADPLISRPYKSRDATQRRRDWRDRVQGV
ncbi:hypothetical protein PFISCL1PPCAC_26187, partial [Pristionchus fissidentatus]